MSKDYYNLLGVSKNADAAELKKAFRKKAQEFHPDKKTGDEKKFKEINEAYSVLSDQKKRAQYDQFGSAGVGGSGQGGFGGFGGGQGGFDFSGFQQGFSEGQGMEFDLGDIFGSAFGGGRRREARGSDISTDARISFKESIFGVQKTIEVIKNSTCNECDGTGAHEKKTKTCHTCNGNGRVAQVQQTIMGRIQTETSCPTCFGTGQIPEKNCGSCDGAGLVRNKEKMTIKIPGGIESGQRLRLSGKGESIKGGLAGDLYIRVFVEPSDRYQKEGADLLVAESISLSDAALGSKKTIETLDGDVTLKIPAGSTEGKMLRIKDKGVVINEKKRGSLYVKIHLDVPQKISGKAKEYFEKLRKEGY